MATTVAAPAESTANTRPAAVDRFHALNALIKSKPVHGTLTEPSRPRASSACFTNAKDWL